MKKFGMVFGVAAVAVVAGCKDPNYSHGGVGSQNEPKDAAPAEAQPIDTVQTCSCPPGTKHEVPCSCGLADCACVVTPKAAETKAAEQKPVAQKPAEQEYTVYVVQNGDYLAKISKRFNVTIASIKRINSLKSDMIRIGQKLKIPGKVDVGEQKAAPAKTASAPAAKKSSAAYAGATKEYVVKGGDTLGAIAGTYGINSRQLKEMNGLSSDVIRVGQKLKVPAEKVVKADKKADKKPVAAKPVEKKAEPAKKVETKPADPASVEAAPADPVVEPVVEDAPADTVVEPAAAPAAAAPQTFEYTVQDGEDITSVVVKFGVSASEIRDLNNLGESDVLKAGQKIRLPAEAQQ